MFAALSARRRKTLFGVIGLVVLVAAAITVAVVAKSGTVSADQDTPGPVLLVPGYGGQLSSLFPLAARLRVAGRTVQVVTLPDGGVGDIVTQAATIQSVVARDLAAGAPSVDLVGYSAGGVAVREWAHEDGHAAHARRIVTIGSPQHGTSVASAASALFGAACSGACAELQTGSELLDALNAGDETPNGPEWTSIWTEDDQTVIPPDSARLNGADNIPIQTVCPADRVTHSGEPRDLPVIGLVVAALGTGALPHPDSSDCGAFTALGQG